MSSTPSEVARDSSCSAETFGYHPHSNSYMEELDFEEMRLGSASSTGPMRPAQNGPADARALTGYPSHGSTEEDFFEDVHRELLNSSEADLLQDQQHSQPTLRDSPIASDVAVGSQAAHASSPHDLAISSSHPAPASSISHVSSPTESMTPSVLSAGSHDSGSPLMATIVERSPTPGPTATLARIADVAGPIDQPQMIDNAGMLASTTLSGSTGLSSEGLTAKEKAVLMRRARKLEKVFGSTLQEHQVTHSLSFARADPLNIVGAHSPTSRRLSDPISSPTRPFVSRGSSPPSSSASEMRWRSAAFSSGSPVSLSDGSPSSPIRRRRSSLSTLGQRASWLGVDLSSPTSPDTVLAPLTNAQRRLRLSKIHHLLGTEVGAEHVFASMPGAGPWLDVFGSAPNPTSSPSDDSKGDWKSALSKAKDSLGRSNLAQDCKGQADDPVNLGSGNEDEASPGLAAGSDRMGGVKRGAKLNDIFGDFPPATLFNRPAPELTDARHSPAHLDDSLSVSYPLGSLCPIVRRNSSQSSFCVYDASIAHLDHLLRTDPEALADVMSTIHDGAALSPEDEIPISVSPLGPAATTQSADLARRRQAAKKLSQFFGMPASALGLFQSTLDTLQEGVLEERELGLLAEGEERGLLGRLDGLRKRAARKLRSSEGEVREE